MAYFATNITNHKFRCSFEICDDKKEPRTTIIVGKVIQIGDNTFSQNFTVL